MSSALRSLTLNRNLQDVPQMSNAYEKAKAFIAECTEAEQIALKKYLASRFPHPLEIDWDVGADTILSAIRRSSDLTKRGVRGIIAEAVFETDVIPELERAGWEAQTIEGDLPFDVRLLRGKLEARIQIKLQRSEKGVPKMYYPKRYPAQALYVVEVQKTRSGTKTTRQTLPGSTTGLEVETETIEKTRPYSFRDFDVIAVNMHPSSRSWHDFRYTVASWLLPRADDSKLIGIIQPVASVANEVWTSNLLECLEWYQSGKKRSVLPPVAQ